MGAVPNSPKFRVREHESVINADLGANGNGNEPKLRKLGELWLINMHYYVSWGMLACQSSRKIRGWDQEWPAGKPPQITYVLSGYQKPAAGDCHATAFCDAAPRLVSKPNPLWQSPAAGHNAGWGKRNRRLCFWQNLRLILLYRLLPLDCCGRFG